MRLVPLGAGEGADRGNGAWAEGPGYPRYDGSWIHAPTEGREVPEFVFEEGHEKTRNEPPPVFVAGTDCDCHLRLPGDHIPARVFRLFKEGRTWFVEGVLARWPVYLGSRPLGAGDRAELSDGDVVSLRPPPTPLGWLVRIRPEDNAYLDAASHKDYPNRYPSRYPCRSSLKDTPPAPEELRRLAWQTDQMRRRSEEDQVRVADWSAFSQYVKRHYYKHGITCTSWAETGRKTPVDEPPQSIEPRPYPPWIAAIVAREQQLPGLDPARQLPFEGCMLASGAPPAVRRDYASGGPPNIQELYVEPPPPTRKPPPPQPKRAARPADPASSAAAAGSRVPPRPPAPPPSLRDAIASAPGGAAPSPAPAVPATPAASSIAARSPGTPATPMAGSAEAAALAAANPHLRTSFREWLESVDEDLYLLQYHDQIEVSYASVAQISEIYVRGGLLSERFFEDMGVKKLGHRRMFEKWFREHCS